jgi:hypothetical protein
LTEPGHLILFEAAVPDKRSLERDGAFLQSLTISFYSFLLITEGKGTGYYCDLFVAEAHQVRDGHLGRATVVHAHGIHVKTHRNAIETHHGKCGTDRVPSFRCQLFSAGGDQQHAFDSLSPEESKHLRLALGSAF